MQSGSRMACFPHIYRMRLAEEEQQEKAEPEELRRSSADRTHKQTMPLVAAILR